MPSITNSCPDYAYELDARLSGARRVAGVDEAGRGPLAGPVTAAAVILDPRRLPAGLNDSKKLGAKQREMLAAEIRASADWAVVHVWIDEIDRLNILRASHVAMCRAIGQLPALPDLALIDGNLLPQDLPVPGRAVVKGDALSLSIAAASILAKTARDRLMIEMDATYPGYGFASHKGYNAPIHQQALNTLGPCPEHRRSWAPIKALLETA